MSFGKQSFSLADISNENKRGVISVTGEIIVNPRYRHVSHFSGGLACVQVGELYGYIDPVLPIIHPEPRNLKSLVSALFGE
jgi:WG repeat protein